MAIEDHNNPNQELKPKSRRIMGGGGPEEEDNQWPPWLKPLLKEHFFVQCNFHGDSPKNECNMYCLDCTNGGSLCPLCLENHKDHRTVQEIVVSRCDKGQRDSEVDIMSVQTYVTNSAKVVFLNERPQLGRVTGARVTSACDVCSRGLFDVCFCFCSLGCKVAGTSRSFEKRVKHTLTELESSNNSSGVEDSLPSPQSLTPSTPQVPTSSSLRKRPRKGIPHRSPLQ